MFEWYVFIKLFDIVAKNIDEFITMHGLNENLSDDDQLKLTQNELNELKVELTQLNDLKNYVA